MNLSTLASVLAIGFLLGVVQADEKKALSYELSEWKFGKVLFGEDASPENLRGKVVVVEYWGAKCPRCLEGISKLSVLDERYRAKGVRFIGAEAHRSGKERIGEVVALHQVKFTVTEGVTGPVSIAGLPHVVVFAVDGKLLFSGHPNDPSFEKIIETAATQVKDLSVKVAEGVESTLSMERTWKNHEGKALVASLKRIEKEKVTFKLKNGNEVSYEIEKLSHEDQELIRRLKRPMPTK